MAKQASASSQREKARPANGSSIVAITPDAGWHLSPAEVEALKRLDEIPDEEIRTDLIPELPREAWARAVKNPYAAALREQTRRKAS